MNLIFTTFGLGILIGGLIVWLVARERDCRASSTKLAMTKPKKREHIIKKQAKGKAEKKQQLLEFLAGKKKITNNQVEKFLGVSNATAERYLNELEKEGKLKQVGKTGRSTHYKVK